MLKLRPSGTAPLAHHFTSQLSRMKITKLRHSNLNVRFARFFSSSATINIIKKESVSQQRSSQLLEYKQSPSETVTPNTDNKSESSQYQTQHSLFKNLNIQSSSSGIQNGEVTQKNSEIDQNFDAEKLRIMLESIRNQALSQTVQSSITKSQAQSLDPNSGQHQLPSTTNQDLGTVTGAVRRKLDLRSVEVSVRENLPLASSKTSWTSDESDTTNSKKVNDDSQITSNLNIASDADKLDSQKSSNQFSANEIQNVEQVLNNQPESIGSAAVTASASAVAASLPPQPTSINTRAPTTISGALKCIYDLSKGKLTVWVCFSALPGYFIASPELSACGLASLFVGTGLCSASSQVTNQLIERDRDAKMVRTCKRPLVTGAVSIEQGRILSITMLTMGSFLLATQHNLLTSLTAILTYSTYVFMYTPLKAISPYNTHVGAISGSLPVCLGFSAALGGCATPVISQQYNATVFSFLSSQLDILLSNPWLPHMGYFFVLQALWQMPHFYSLAWLCKEDYKTAGYKMFCIHDDTGKETAKICKPYMAALLCYPALGVYMKLTSSMFLLDATLATMMWIHFFRKFEQNPTKRSCRKFFLASVVQLLALIICFSVHARARDDRQSEPAWRQSIKRQMANTICAHEWLFGPGVSHSTNNYEKFGKNVNLSESDATIGTNNTNKFNDNRNYNGGLTFDDSDHNNMQNTADTTGRNTLNSSLSQYQSPFSNFCPLTLLGLSGAGRTKKSSDENSNKFTENLSLNIANS